MRTFTTDGPGDATLHHLLPSAPRLAEARSLVEQGRYFVFRAPGRSGKTTAVRTFAAELTAEGRFAALCCSTKAAASVQSDVVLLQNTLLSALRIAAEQDLPEALRPPAWPSFRDATALWEGLTAWSNVCPLPIVIFFDDFDALPISAIETILQQLESGFSRRPAHFPWSIAIVTQFDFRRIADASGKESKNFFATGPFEHTWFSRLLPPWTKDEIRAFYTRALGFAQETIAPEVIDFLHEASAGHPYFIQALGRELAELASSSTSLTLTQATMAFRQVVARLDSPIDNLQQRLLEPGVRHVIEPLLLGQTSIASASETEVQFVRDLGLVTLDDPLRIEGALHRAILPRLISLPARRVINVDPQSNFDSDGRLHLETLLVAFTIFFESAAPDLLPAMLYSKIAAELVFLAFLFQVLEGRGFIDIEFGKHRARLELTINVPVVNGDEKTIEQRETIVLIARRKRDSKVKKKALEWLEDAMHRSSSDSGTLVIFDKRDKHRPGERSKLYEMVTSGGKTVRVLRT
jgi:hypothetical protein